MLHLAFPRSFLFFNKFIYYFMFWLRWVFVAVRGLSLAAASGGTTLRCGARASHCGGFSCCRARVLERILSSCGAQA